MKTPLVIIALLVTLVTADAQVDRGGGIFGFGRKREQINPGLFPDSAPMQTSAPIVYPEATEQAAPTSTRSVTPQMPAPNGENIFRSGQPKPLDSTSYTIEEGRKVENVDDKKKGRLFGFGKKEKKEDEIVTPVPAASYADTTSTPVESAAPAPPIVSEAIAANEAEDESTSLSDAFPQPGNDKKGGGILGFFGRDKKEAAPAPAATEPTAPAMNETVETATPVVAETTTAAPQSQPSSAEPTAPVPNFASNDLPAATPEKEKEGFSLPNPMKNFKAPSIKPPTNPIKALRPPERKKDIDMTNAETIIANGEIVEAQDDLVESNIVETGDGHRDAPQVINGVTTYSSWDDVAGSSTSAADKILNQIR